MKFRHSFFLPVFILSLLLGLASCAPSTSAIQTAIAQTLTAAPTATSTGTASPAPAPTMAPPFPADTEIPPDTLILITPDYYETATESPENPESPTTPLYSELAIATVSWPKETYPTHALTSKDLQPVGHTFENGFLLVAVMIVLAFFMWREEKDKHK